MCIRDRTSNGCITDVDGNFTLTVSPKATMVISYVGYVTQEIPLNGQKNIKIALDVYKRQPYCMPDVSSTKVPTRYREVCMV